MAFWSENNPLAVLDPEYSCEPYAGSVCQNVGWADDLIFVNKTLGVQSQLENSVVKLLNAFPGDNCARAFTPLACGLAFPPCDKSTDIERPRRVCREYCEYVRDQACPDTWKSKFGQLTALLDIDPLPIPDCDSLPRENGGDSPTCLIGISNYTGELCVDSVDDEWSYDVGFVLQCSSRFGYLQYYK